MLSRPRRNRKSPWLRAAHRETTLSPANFIYPLFLHEENLADVPIASMPGCFRFGGPGLLREVERALDLGVRAVVLFPAEKDSHKTAGGE